MHHRAEVSSDRLEAADQIGVVTTNVARLMETESRALVAGTGVESSAMRIMSEVVHADRRGVRPSKLADLLSVDLSTISRQIRAAEDAGLVAVVVDPGDRRASLVQLTSQGREKFYVIRDRRAALLAQLLEGWDDAHIALLSASLTDLATSLRRRRGSAAGS